MDPDGPKWKLEPTEGLVGLQEFEKVLLLLLLRQGEGLMTQKLPLLRQGEGLMTLVVVEMKSEHLQKSPCSGGWVV